MQVEINLVSYCFYASLHNLAVSVVCVRSKLVSLYTTTGGWYKVLTLKIVFSKSKINTSNMRIGRILH